MDDNENAPQEQNNEPTQDAQQNQQPEPQTQQPQEPQRDYGKEIDELMETVKGIAVELKQAIADIAIGREEGSIKTEPEADEVEDYPVIDINALIGD